MTHNKSFVSSLTVINNVRKRIEYMLEDIFVSFFWSDLHIESLIGYKNITWYINFTGDGNFLEYGHFLGYGRPGIKCK